MPYYLDDSGLEYFWDSIKELLSQSYSINFGYSDGVTNSNGVTTFNPGLGVKPDVVFVTHAKASAETEAVAKIAVPMVWSIDNATQVQVRWKRTDRNAWITDANRVGCYWLAIARKQ